MYIELRLGICVRWKRGLVNSEHSGYLKITLDTDGYCLFWNVVSMRGRDGCGRQRLEAEAVTYHARLGVTPAFSERGKIILASGKYGSRAPLSEVREGRAARAGRAQTPCIFQYNVYHLDNRTLAY